MGGMEADAQMDWCFCAETRRQGGLAGFGGVGRAVDGWAGGLVDWRACGLAGWRAGGLVGEPTNSSVATRGVWQPVETARREGLAGKGGEGVAGATAIE